MATSSKSSAIALCALYGHLTVDECVRAARVDEDFQIERFGLVEGAHDLDEAFLYTTFGAAKSLVDLSLIRDI